MHTTTLTSTLATLSTKEDKAPLPHFLIAGPLASAELTLTDGTIIDHVPPAPLISVGISWPLASDLASLIADIRSLPLSSRDAIYRDFGIDLTLGARLSAFAGALQRWLSTHHRPI